MAYRKSHSKRRGRKSRRNRNSHMTLPWKAAALAGTALAVLGTGGFIAAKDMNTVKPDEMGCYPVPGGQAQTTVLVDSSDPGFDAVQSRDLINGISREFRDMLGFNERLSIVTTQESRIGSIPNPVLTLCGSAKAPSDLEKVGASSATQAYLARQAEMNYEQKVLPELNGIFSTDPNERNRQRFESPILEQIQSVSRMSEFRNATGNRLIIASDMLQNTQEVQFCQTKGHLPSFSKFKAKPYFERVRPSPLNGADITVYMLIRGQLGKKPYPYCTEQELRTFWTEYFQDAGAGNVEFIRVRRDPHASAKQ